MRESTIGSMWLAICNLGGRFLSNPLLDLLSDKFSYVAWFTKRRTKNWSVVMLTMVSTNISEAEGKKSSLVTSHVFFGLTK